MNTARVMVVDDDQGLLRLMSMRLEAAGYKPLPASSGEQALAQLPDRQRMALTLCHYQELSNIEAAKVMDVSVDALESLLARGRRGLRDRLSPLRQALTGKMSDEPTATIN